MSTFSLAIKENNCVQPYSLSLPRGEMGPWPSAPLLREVKLEVSMDSTPASSQRGEAMSTFSSFLAWPLALPFVDSRNGEA